MLYRSPFVGFVVCFAEGIIVGNLCIAAFSNSSGWLLAALIPAFTGCCVLLKSNRSGAFTISVYCFLILLGAFCRVNAEEERETVISAFSNQKPLAYEAEITSLPENRAKSVRFEAALQKVFNGETWTPAAASMLINLPADCTAYPKVGDYLVVRGSFGQPTAPSNPYQFDYRRYLRNKGVLFTAQPRAGHFAVVETKKSWNLKAELLSVSVWADQIFRQNLKDQGSYGLIKAMLLGRRDDLQEEQTNDYIGSGSVHILSVSGMHVAIIFLIITTLFGWLKGYRFGKGIYLAINILFLTFYAMLTGLSPSVLRATIMCIVFVLAEVAGRKHESMNTLAISALLILLFDSAALFDVGFQLSYLAMAGIFLLYDHIYIIFEPKNRFSKFVWQITSLAFAAQLATFPLSLYYFHQFPTYFWLVNPFVITFTNIMLPVALILLAVSLLGFGWLNWLVALVVDWTGWLTNFSAGIPKHLPGYLIENVHLGMVESVLLYLIILLAWYALETQQYRFLKYAFATTLATVILAISTTIHSYISQETVVFNVPKHEVIAYKTGDKLYLACDADLKSDQRAFNFYIKNYIVNAEIRELIYLSNH